MARKVANGCSNLSFTEERNRPDAVQVVNALNAQYRTAGISAQLTAGQVAFTCRKGGQVMQGFYFAGTQLTQGYGIGMWSVQYLYGYLVASGKGPVAQQVLNRLMTSAQPNPQWVARQQGLTAETAEIGRRTQAEISKLITDSYWSRQGTQDELSRRRSNATLGVEDVIDNVTGTQYKIESGANYYWIDHNERIVGTDTYTRPTLDFREMVRLP